MLLFIALPIVSVAYQSLFVEHEQVVTTVESCGPFGCTTETRVDAAAMAELRERAADGPVQLARHLHQRLATSPSTRSPRSGATARASAPRSTAMMNLPLYKALTFTIAYTVIVTPLVIVARLPDRASPSTRVPKLLKGPVIFFSLLPMIVTPLIGSLVLFWMIDAQGVIGATLQRIFNDPQLSLKASPTLTWVTLFVYGVWHHAPFSFIVFYAGLQTVPEDTLEVGDDRRRQPLGAHPLRRHPLPHAARRPSSR